MTLVSDIIQRAYRASNIIPIGSTPSAAQTTEALPHFNSIILSTVGNEAGDGLTDITIGGTYDQSEYVEEWVPNSSRLLLNLTEAKTYYLDPNPQDGQRFAIVDVDGNLATYNVILNGNGRMIETAATVTLNTNSLAREWFYRADLGGWVRFTPLVAGDTMPFPDDFNPYFTIMLASHLSPQYGQTLSPEQLQMLRRARTQLSARYAQIKQIRPEVDHLFSSQDAFRYGFTGNFNKGYPFSWM